jgi:hypothetical protein
MTTTQAELVADVQSYAKRADLTTLITSTFIPYAESRMGRDLRSRENESIETWVAASSPLVLPADYGQIRSIEVAQDRGPKTLVSVDLQTLNQYPTSDPSPPMVYAISGQSIYVRPAGSGDFTMYYWSRPAITPTEGNAVLVRWPQLYVYATLVELHRWERDADQAQLALDDYRAEVARINRDASRADGAKPAMRRV